MNRLAVTFARPPAGTARACVRCSALHVRLGFSRSIAVIAAASMVVGCSCGETVIGATGERDGGPKGGTKGGPDARGVPDAEGGARAVGPDSSLWNGVESRSGSRIKVLGFRSDDVLTVATNPSLRDAQKNTTCFVTFAADGKMRCLPNHQVVVFTDSNCTSPIAAVPNDPCGGTPDYAYASEFWGGEDTCPRKGIAAFALGAAIDSPANLYVQSIFGCAPRDRSTSPETYREATPTPTSDWIGFESTVTKVTERLGVLSWDGSDGSRLVVSAALLPAGTACSGTTQGGAAARCVPSDVLPIDANTEGLFGDGACTGNLASRCVPNPDLIEAARDPSVPVDPCVAGRFRDVRSLFRVGDEVDHAAIHSVRTNGCDVAADNQILGAWHYYAVGASVPFESYPGLGIAFSGKGRLEQEYLVADDGTKLFALPSKLYDSVSEVDCEPRDVLGDGHTVCVPRDALAGDADYWTDAACTDRLAQGDGCRPPLAYASISRTTLGAPPDERCTTSLHSITPYSAPLYAKVFENGIDSCAASPPQSSSLYRIGGAIAPESLFPPLVPEEP